MVSDDTEGVNCCEEVDTGVDAADDETEGVGWPLNRFFTSNLGLFAAPVAGFAEGVWDVVVAVVAVVGGGVADAGGFEGGFPFRVTEEEWECAAAAAMEPKLLTPSPLTAGVGVAAGDDERGAAASSIEPKVTGEVPARR